MSSRKRYKAEDVLKEFVQMPKWLFNTEFNDLSNDAKVLYCLLSDRNKLSTKNNWIDESGDIFFLYTRDNMKKILNCGINKARKCFDELVESKLLEEERQGQGKPNKIYLLDIVIENAKTIQNRYSGISKTDTLDYSKQIPSNNNLNNNNSINNNTSKNITVEKSDKCYKNKNEAKNDIVNKCNIKNNLEKYFIEYFLDVLEDMDINHYLMSVSQLKTIKDGLRFLSEIDIEISQAQHIISYYFSEQGYKTLYGMLEPKKLNYILCETDILDSNNCYDEEGNIKDYFDV